MNYIHVLSGSQSGSSLILEKDKLYHVANNFDSDIYIKCGSDSELVELFFSTTEQSVKFEKMSGSITNSKEIINLNVEYQMPFICNMNGVDLIFTSEANYDNAYSYYESKILINTDSVKQTEVEENDDGLQMDDFFSDQIENSIIQPQKKNIIFSIINPYIYKLRYMYSSLGKFAYLMIFFGFLLLFGVSIMVYQYSKQSKSMDVSEQNQKFNIDLKNKLALLPRQYSSLSYTSEQGKYVVSGVVAKHEELAKVKLLLNKLDPKIVVRLWAFEDIASQLLTILRQNNIYKADAHFNQENSVIELSGITSSLEKLDNAEIIIDNKFKGIGEMDTNRVFLISVLEKDLQNILNQNEYKQKLTIDKDYEQGHINLGGYLSQDELGKLQLQIDAFNQKYLPVIKMVPNIQNSILALPFTINAIYTGTDPWILTENGERIYVGGSYKGVTLISIDDEKVVFKKNFMLAIGLDQLISYEGG